MDFTLKNSEKIANVEIHSAVLYFTIDPKLTWLAKIKGRVPEFMVIQRLRIRRDVYSEHEDISALEENKKSDKAMKELESILKDENFFYGVRGHAARALGRLSTDETSFASTKVLKEFYQSNFMSKKEQEFVVKPNNFSNVSLHFVQLEVIKGLSIIRDAKDETPSDVADFLLDIAKNTKNDGNKYRDDYLISEIFTAIGRIKSGSDNYYEEVWGLIREKLSLLKWIPSYCNCVTNSLYTALTSIYLKRFCNENIKIDERSEQQSAKLESLVREMREFVVEESEYFESRASMFKCLLYLAHYGEIAYDDVFVVLKVLAQTSQRNMAAMCLRVFTFFIIEPMCCTNDRKFEGYLLAFQSDVTSDMITAKLQGRLEYAETLWEIMTRYGQYDVVLRDAAFSLWVAIFGEGVPSVYASYRPSGEVIDLSVDSSGGNYITIRGVKKFIEPVYKHPKPQKL